MNHSYDESLLNLDLKNLKYWSTYYKEEGLNRIFSGYKLKIV